MKRVLAGQLLAAVLAAGAALVPAASWAQAASRSAVQTLERYKVVFQVSDDNPEKWALALNNARNIQAQLGKQNVDIEIVAYGPGLSMLKAESKVAPRLAEALDHNIALLACENTMRNTNVRKEDMYGGIGYVPAGVVHIMKREREGWAYIRP